MEICFAIISFSKNWNQFPLFLCRYSEVISFRRKPKSFWSCKKLFIICKIKCFLQIKLKMLLRERFYQLVLKTWSFWPKGKETLINYLYFLRSPSSTSSTEVNIGVTFLTAAPFLLVVIYGYKWRFSVAAHKVTGSHFP